MKCQILLSGKNIIKLPSAENAKRVVKVIKPSSIGIAFAYHFTLIIAENFMCVWFIFVAGKSIIHGSFDMKSNSLHTIDILLAPMAIFLMLYYCK